MKNKYNTSFFCLLKKTAVTFLNHLGTLRLTKILKFQWVPRTTQFFSHPLMNYSMTDRSQVTGKSLSGAIYLVCKKHLPTLYCHYYCFVHNFSCLKGPSQSILLFELRSDLPGISQTCQAFLRPARQFSDLPTSTQNWQVVQRPGSLYSNLPGSCSNLPGLCSNLSGLCSDLAGLSCP